MTVKRKLFTDASDHGKKASAPRPHARALRATVALSTAAFVAAAVGGGCASSRSTTEPCTPPWSGTCTLRQVTKLGERSAPVPLVIYEGLYEPQGAPNSVPMARVTVEARAVYAGDVKAYFHAQPEVSCEQLVDDQCFPGALSVRLSPFTPPTEVAAPQVTGCARIEQESADYDASADDSGAETLPEQLLFEEGAVTQTAPGTSVLDALATRLKAEPNLECLAVVGMSASGESPGLAEQRARTVRNALIERGVEPGRLRTVSVTASLYGPNTRPENERAKDRRVVFRVLLSR